MKIIASAVLFLAAAFAIHTGFAPRYAFGALEASAMINNQAQSVKDTLIYAPEFDSLVREKALREALLKLSLNDSISLVVNLRDSTVNLSIKGVIIHTSKVKFTKVDPLLMKLPAKMYLDLFSNSLKILEEKATIVKEPIVVVQAPKDTIEASRNAYKPDTLIQNPAYLKMKLSYGISLRFDQEKATTWNDKWVRLIFSTDGWSGRIAQRLKNFATFQRQVYKPEIRVKLPVDDLRSIYRALPEEASVVICY